MEAETKKVYLSRYQKVREDDLKRGRFGYAKLQWKNREFFIQKRLIHLGRHSTNTDADVDLGEEMNLSRKHAAIRYNEEKETFELEVLGKNGAFVRGVLITKDQPPIALANRDLIQMGDNVFFFLTPQDQAFHEDLAKKAVKKRRAPRANGQGRGTSKRYADR
mmetsp:Transcript_4492/g.16122  ORF Transcript_4492/g.16122 Transcript_4492/m.16122 type:complete len:163 (-) Transcript_4492:389-877(-)